MRWRASRLFFVCRDARTHLIVTVLASKQEESACVIAAPSQPLCFRASFPCLGAAASLSFSLSSFFFCILLDVARHPGMALLLRSGHDVTAESASPLCVASCVCVSPDVPGNGAAPSLRCSPARRFLLFVCCFLCGGFVWLSPEVRPVRVRCR